MRASLPAPPDCPERPHRTAHRTPTRPAARTRSPVVARGGAFVDLGRVARHPDRDAGEQPVGGGYAERLGEGVVVEAGELVGVQSHRPRLQGQVRRGLADVVERVVAVRPARRPSAPGARGQRSRRPPRPGAPSPSCRGSACAHQRVVPGSPGTQTKKTHGWRLPALGPTARRAGGSRSRAAPPVRVVVHARAPARAQRLGEVDGTGLRGSVGHVAVWLPVPLVTPPVSPPSKGWDACEQE